MTKTSMTAVAPGDVATVEAGVPAALLRVENLRVSFERRGRTTPVVHGVSFALEAGRCLAIVGESGSGKSVTARTLVGLTGPGARVQADRLELGGRDLTRVRGRGWRAVRGREVGLVLQDALVSLDQLRTVGAEVGESLRLHRRTSREERERRVLEALAEVGVPEPALRARQRPYELSGGLRQRALIASALAPEPRLLVADEPTTALDVTVQAQVLELLAESKARGQAVLLISHDLAVVASIADEVCVMKDGRIVEAGRTAQVLRDPRHPYTRALVAAVPSGRTRGTRLTGAPPAIPAVGVGRVERARTQVGEQDRTDGGEPTPVLEARSLVKHFRGPDGVRRTVVDDVSFALRRGTTLGVVGESGSGKTTTARMALAMLAPDEGEVLLDGGPWSALTTAQRAPLRPRVGVVYQDPLSSFDPRWTVGRILADALRTGPDGGARTRERSLELLGLVGLGAEHLDRRPLSLSGGQRQRVAIARALAPQPDVVVLDEPVSALDVSVQAQVLDLLTDLQDALGLTYLFISHDLGVIRHMSHDVLVMTGGRVVESGNAQAVLADPQHEYTRRLLEALPSLTTAATTATATATTGGRP